jgi:plasmid stability protein
VAPIFERCACNQDIFEQLHHSYSLDDFSWYSPFLRYFQAHLFWKEPLISGSFCIGRGLNLKGHVKSIILPLWNHFGVTYMATLTIKNIPSTLYDALKQQAAVNHRSLNGEVIVSLEQAVRKQGVAVQEILTRARSVRIKMSPDTTLTNQIINRAKRQGRA